MKRMVERENQIKEREQEAYDIVIHGTNKAQSKLSTFFISHNPQKIVEELEKEDLSEGEIERALELNKQKEIRKALNAKGPVALFEKSAELQQFNAMIDKKNLFTQPPPEKMGKKLSQTEAVKLFSKV